MKLKLHWQILIGMIIGAIFGFVMNAIGLDWIIIEYFKPIGNLFIRLISMIAVPLVLASLITGVASMKDIKKLSRIGGKTIAIYILTTAIAISFGLIFANIFNPGKGLEESVKEQLRTDYSSTISDQIQNVDVNMIDQLVNIVPVNPFYALATERGEMLQVVFFALFLGVSLTMIKSEKAETVIVFFDGLTDALIKIVEIVMKLAPYGVFALIAAVVADFGFEILKPLGKYATVVFAALMFHMVFSYGLILKFFSKVKLSRFIKSITEVQLVAFSSSSSAATLPLTMEVAEKKIGIKEEVTSFVLPLGATINMDGTALYQGVAAIFIAQVYGLDLNLAQQLTIVLTATLASIGTAAVPGVGMVMLVIVLQSINVPAEGIALIFGVDRILDMLRTAVNVTGDTVIASVIASQENLLTPDEELDSVA